MFKLAVPGTFVIPVNAITGAEPTITELPVGVIAAPNATLGTCPLKDKARTPGFAVLLRAIPGTNVAIAKEATLGVIATSENCFRRYAYFINSSRSRSNSKRYGRSKTN
jgi:hypothetical protein